MADLQEYHKRRNRSSTPEPFPDKNASTPHGNDDTFVIHEHHATSLHWDVRFERNGVLVSWAVPKGLPPDPGNVRLAVHTEDHPLEYASFSGEIPKGQYGAGTVTIWDAGTYETVKWSESKVEVVLAGRRVQGKYVFIRSNKNWLVLRAGASQNPDWQPMPTAPAPMLATPGPLPSGADDGWAYEFKWDGVRALAQVEGGRVTFRSRLGNELTSSFPELRALGEQLGSTQALLDGEIVSIVDGRPRFSAVASRLHVGSSSAARRLARTNPVTYLLFDLLHLDGASCLDLPYRQRRGLLAGLELDGEHWRAPPYYEGNGEAVWRASQEQGLEGVVAKRLDSHYRLGQRSPEWRKIPAIHTLEVVIGGWHSGRGRRSERLGALLVGLPTSDGLRYIGRIGTGFSDNALTTLTPQLKRLGRARSPFSTHVPRESSRDAQWVRPTLVGEVTFRGWTDDQLLRHASWRGLRLDKTVDSLREEREHDE